MFKGALLAVLTLVFGVTAAYAMMPTNVYFSDDMDGRADGVRLRDDTLGYWSGAGINIVFTTQRKYNGTHSAGIGGTAGPVDGDVQSISTPVAENIAILHFPYAQH